ncbi:Uncharacterized protein Anas_01626 [Armadillidium nasatum]|uniref:BLOC-1-related complex subunit 6 C-terminal helix domain-containing protein n=1 Tax=Armadillidium nasatum TaxID=96803 RepID=A0A5N5SJ39_9CRUS|nr:Uncharacterized protein Anas_01626 [Armadillidium nasatum]
MTIIHFGTLYQAFLIYRENCRESVIGYLDKCLALNNPANYLVINIFNITDAATIVEDEKDEGQRENPFYEEDYVSLWQRTNHGSVDLDEKLTSMTGSYSEILDDSHETDPECENTLICDDTCISHVQPHELEKNRKESNSKAICQESGAKLSKDETPSSSRGLWFEGSQEDSICELIRDFSQRNIVSRSLTLVYPALPPIDPTVIGDLEERARDVATSMDTLIENLTGTLHSISALSVECVETYRDAVCKTCDAVDSNIKSMYQLMAKCEELSKSMKSVYKLHDEMNINNGLEKKEKYFGFEVLFKKYKDERQIED